MWLKVRHSRQCKLQWGCIVGKSGHIGDFAILLSAKTTSQARIECRIIVEGVGCKRLAWTPSDRMLCSNKWVSPHFDTLSSTDCYSG